MSDIIITGTIGKPEPELARELEKSGIGEWTTADNVRKQAAEHEEKTELNVIVNSIGGDVIEGFEIADFLNSLKSQGKKIKTIGQRYDSIASVIFLAGDERKHVAGAKPMIHNSWRMPESLSGLQLNADLFEAIAEEHKKTDSELLFEYLKVAGREKAEILRNLMMQEAELTDSQVMELNFATEVIRSEKGMAGRSLAFNSKILNQFNKVMQYSDVIAMIDGQVLLIQRNKRDDFEAGKWAFPGGKVEEGETPEIAAKREFKEEVGIECGEIKFVESVKNEDGSISFYFLTELSGEPFMTSEEVEDYQIIEPSDIAKLDIIKNGGDRYEVLINKSISMTNKEIAEKQSGMGEQLTKLEKGLNALKAFFVGGQKSMLLPLQGGETELFIFSEDGEIEGKRAVIADDGEPTEEAAPAGQHELNDGRTITVGENGIIESVSEAEQAMTKEEMEAAIAKKDEEMQAALAAKDKEMEALKAQYQEKEQSLNEAVQGINALKADFENFKKEVPGDNEGKRGAKAQKKEEVNWKDMKPSERRILATKIELTNKD